MVQIRGVINALATPFTPDGDQVDIPRLRSLVDDVVAGGVHGIAPCGSTGEFNCMTTAERRLVVETVVDQAAGRVPVIAHTGSLTTADAVALSRHAEKVGADGVMLVAPFYEPLNLDEVRRYYRTVADAVSIDVTIYNLPVATGVNLLPEDVADLCRAAPNIKYIKDTSGDFGQTTRLIHQFSDVVGTFVGLDTMFLAVAAEGATGSLVGAANIIPSELVAIWDHVQQDRLGEAREAWQSVYPLMLFLTQGGYVTGVKAAMECFGRSINDPRPPYERLTGARREELEQIVKAFRFRSRVDGR
jgi:4-hydroxy-tetrahydrodipicolinate synthase